jgi:hypothetical protein
VRRPSRKHVVEIPDQSFQNTLISRGVDINSDSQISYTEAEATETLVLPPSGITDLTGLEAFVNLDSLTITLNPLAGIDLSSNTLLRYLDITYCDLTDLDLSNNPGLEVLNCGRNGLSELNLTNNQGLHTLICNNNLLEHLDLSTVNALNTMISCGNQLSYLDISKHTQLRKIGVDNMPMLTEVCVWTLPFPPDGVMVLQDFSPNIQYTTECSR